MPIQPTADSPRAIKVFFLFLTKFHLNSRGGNVTEQQKGTKGNFEEESVVSYYTGILLHHCTKTLPHIYVSVIRFAACFFFWPAIFQAIPEQAVSLLLTG